MIESPTNGVSNTVNLNQDINQTPGLVNRLITHIRSFESSINWPSIESGIAAYENSLGSANQHDVVREWAQANGIAWLATGIGLPAAVGATITATVTHATGSGSIPEALALGAAIGSMAASPFMVQLIANRGREHQSEYEPASSILAFLKAYNSDSVSPYLALIGGGALGALAALYTSSDMLACNGAMGALAGEIAALSVNMAASRLEDFLRTHQRDAGQSQV